MENVTPRLFPSCLPVVSMGQRRTLDWGQCSSWHSNSEEAADVDIRLPQKNCLKPRLPGALPHSPAGSGKLC